MSKDKRINDLRTAVHDSLRQMNAHGARVMDLLAGFARETAPPREREPRFRGQGSHGPAANPTVGNKARGRIAVHAPHAAKAGRRGRKQARRDERGGYGRSGHQRGTDGGDALVKLQAQVDRLAGQVEALTARLPPVPGAELPVPPNLPSPAANDALPTSPSGEGDAPPPALAVPIVAPPPVAAPGQAAADALVKQSDLKLLTRTVARLQHDVLGLMNPPAVEKPHYDEDEATQTGLPDRVAALEQSGPMRGFDALEERVSNLEGQVSNRA